ncbi:ribose 5-phosphate isomerase B [Rummeliibacillus suwonensis]|uniref:ribose 5-phosphate isomerase B n=1 Tax=Rummeliibacillus suwonensis TaxID=1306154 RepID=UPI001AAFD6FC|nr:ribose 5-phosphate isomerase B [Rummeliibacillus suwonensis]MBO2535616.1 ribose 5-phosphate isomerase B [Rummeliibacillus suwonensis]
MLIGIGSDHIGFKMKELIKHYLVNECGIDVVDVGTNNSSRTDYPIYAEKCCNLVKKGKVDFGVLICGTGIGMEIAANKISGIRATVVNDILSAELSRKHNNANVVCFGARIVGTGVAKKITSTFLMTRFEGGRHKKRLCEIECIENKNMLRFNEIVNQTYERF